MRPRFNSPSPPTQLISIQTWLQAAITSGTFDSKEAADVITQSDTRSSDERIATYLDDYWPRCFESLTDDYPRTARALGPKWESLCTDYLRTFPSDRFTLYYLGRNLPTYAASLKLSQWIKDLIHVEWALLNASIAARFPLTEITATTPLSLQPHATLLHLNYPIRELLKEKRCKKQPESVIVCHDTHYRYTVLSPLIARVFEEFKRGHSLSDTFDILSQSGLSEIDLDLILAQIQEWMSIATQQLWIVPSSLLKE